MADDGKWKFSGRFDGYPAGTVRDPRNGNKMTEQKFVRLSDNQAPTDEKMLRAQRLVWLHDLQDLVGQKAEAQQALEFAVKTSPRQSELWEKKIDAWSKLIPPPAPSVWKTFLDSLKREFRDDTDLLTVARQAEDQYVLAKVGAEMVKNELRSDIRDLGKLKGLTSLDEIRSAHKRYADGKGIETEAPLDEVFDIGIFTASPGDKTFRAGNVLSLKPQRLRTGKQRMTAVVDRKPSFVGVDPYIKYIDRNAEDNVQPVTAP